MCGINGIFYFDPTLADPAQLAEQLNRMQRLTSHRGPDQSDIKILPGAALGTSRLAVIAPHEHSTIQTDPRRGLHAVFNGELVNHRSLRSSLILREVSGHSDTALILPMFTASGDQFVKSLAGMFAIAIYDERRRELKLLRDPLGVKPLYYVQTADYVMFSSEIKAIYAALPDPPPVSFAAIDYALRYRFVPGRSTVFPSIKRVLPGESITVNATGVIFERFWELGRNPAASNSSTSIGEFRSLLSRVVTEHADADVAGGYFVSGGLDSAITTAIGLSQSQAYRTPISLRFSPNSTVDERYGQVLEQHLGTSFEWVDVSDATARQTLVELCPFLDEPLENPIHIGTYLMAKRARELGLKSVITGDGADEFFIGYDRYMCWFTEPTAPQAAAIYEKLSWSMTPHEASELYTPAALMARASLRDSFERPIAPFASLASVLQFERTDRLPEYHNMRLDRMTMAHGIEAKVPFLDHRIVEYSLQLSLAQLSGKTAKGYLKAAAEAWLPAQIIHRPKIHFPSLPDQWLRGDGAKWAADILLDQSAITSQWIRRDVLESYLKDHTEEAANHGRVLWALVVLELWTRNLKTWRS